MLKIFIKYSLFSLFIAVHSCMGAQEITTQVLGKNSPDFAITAHALVPERNAVVLGTNGFDRDKRFTLSYLLRTHTKLTRFTPEYAYVNGSKRKQRNPLYGASISHIAPFGHALAIATHTKPTQVYFTTWPYDQTATVATTDILAGEKDPEIKQQKIIALVSNTQWSAYDREIDDLAASIEHVQENTQNQEQKNTVKKENALFVGLAGIPNKLTVGLLLLDTITTQEKPENNAEEQEYQERTQFVWRHTRQDKSRVPLYKHLLTLDSPQVSFGGPLSALDSCIDIHYDTVLDRVYYALTLTTGDTPESQGCGLLVGTVADNKLSLVSVAPAAVFSSINTNNNHHVLGARGARKRVALERVRTLHTSTGYAYSLVVTQQGVYAYGLVNARNTHTGALAQDAQEFHGTLACADNFASPALEYRDIANYTKAQVQVGGDAVLPGPITDIQVFGEAVFVSVAHAQKDQLPGIFHSQALLASNGKIVAWTPWRRTASITKPVQSFMYDSGYGIFWYITPQARSINYSHWGTGTWNLQRSIPQELMDKGGIQGARSFYHTTTGFNQVLGKRMSLLALTGVNTVMLVQTGRDEKQIFKPSLGTRSMHYTQGSITHVPDNTQILVISGGALRSLGAITQTEIVSDGEHAWLVVAGAKGLAVLSCADGSGWPVCPGLSSDFVNLPANMSFKVLGDYKGIRRISACDNRLYILTHEKLDRIVLTQQIIKTGTIEPVTLKSIKNHRYFSDMCVLEPLILVAGNDGLSCSGASAHAATAACQAAMHWTNVALPQAVGPIAGPAPATRLYAVSSHVDNTRYSNVYVLNGYVLGGQAQVYRYTVIDNNIQPIDTTYFFTPRGEYRNFIAPDGSFMLASRSARPESPIIVELWPWSTNKKIKQLHTTDAKYITVSQEAHSIGRITYDDALGTWLIYGEFGVLLPG